MTQQEFARRLGEATHAGGPSPDVDLLIRTGGERRLSDFLLWECAYAELVFTPRMWPEFSGADLSAAVHEYEAETAASGRFPKQPRDNRRNRADRPELARQGIPKAGTQTLSLGRG